MMRRGLAICMEISLVFAAVVAIVYAAKGKSFAYALRCCLQSNSSKLSSSIFNFFLL